MSAVLKKSTPGRFAYTCHFQQIGINATKIKKTGIHFKTDVFAAVAVVDAKAAYYAKVKARAKKTREVGEGEDSLQANSPFGEYHEKYTLCRKPHDSKIKRPLTLYGSVCL